MSPLEWWDRPVFSSHPLIVSSLGKKGCFVLHGYCRYDYCFYLEASRLPSPIVNVSVGYETLPDYSPFVLLLSPLPFWLYQSR